MLCSKFELIPTSIFQVIVILKNEPKSEKIPVQKSMGYSPWIFAKNGSEITKKFITFFDTY